MSNYQPCICLVFEEENIRDVSGRLNLSNLLGDHSLEDNFVLEALDKRVVLMPSNSSDSYFPRINHTYLFASWNYIKGDDLEEALDAFRELRDEVGGELALSARYS